MGLPFQTRAIVFLFGLTLAAPCLAAADQQRSPVLPTGAETSCTYEHVPFQSFSYVNGKVRATWGADYRILEMYIVADWEIVSSYSPGTIALLPLDPSKGRYDFVGKARLLSTGETFHLLTPIWCAGSPETIPAPVQGCFGGSDFPRGGCTVDSNADCPDGSKKSCSCSGDVGTCHDCGVDGQKACCTSSTTRVFVDPATGRVTTTTTLSKCEHSCKN